MVYVAAEGPRTEGDYVRLLNERYGRRTGKPEFSLTFCSPGKNGARPEEVVDLVLRRASGPDDEKWALFDRDSKDQRDQEIADAMRKAAREGVQVAMSHPSFELWLLLHFQDLTSRENGDDTSVKDRLRKHPKAKGFEEYDKASGDRGKGLDARRATSLSGKEGDAIRRARGLVNRCPHGTCDHERARTESIGAGREPYERWTRRTGHAGDCDPLHRDPSSDVWRLLEHLGITGEEDDEPGDGKRGKKNRKR